MAIQYVMKCPQTPKLTSSEIALEIADDPCQVDLCLSIDEPAVAPAFRKTTNRVS